MAANALKPLIIRVLRAPALLYDCDLGWVFGRRFLRLTHRGRRSGRLFQMMLEVLGERPAEHELFVMVGLGRRAQWYRNVIVGGAVEIAIGRERFQPTYREVPGPEAAAVLADYEQRNRLLIPILHMVLSRLVGWRYDGSAAARQRLVSERPILAFRPVS
jgi:deazaflavin-dependent oxidoreductase (nitroreductase family)